MAGINHRKPGSQRIMGRMVIHIPGNQHIRSRKQRMADVPASAASQNGDPADLPVRVSHKPQRRNAKRLFNPPGQLTQGAALRKLAHPAQTEGTPLQIHGIQIVGNLFVWVGLKHSRYHPFLHTLGDDGFQPDFVHLLKPAGFSDKRLRPFLRQEGSLAFDIKGAIAVFADPPGPCREYRLLDLPVMRLGHKHHQLLQLLGMDLLQVGKTCKSQRLRQKIINPALRHIQIGMGDINRDVMLDQLGVQASGGSVRAQVGDRPVHDGMMGNDELRPLADSLVYHLMGHIQRHQHLADLLLQGAQLQADAVVRLGIMLGRQLLHQLNNGLSFCKHAVSSFSLLISSKTFKRF
ncbi:hypothetical protein D3C75_763060 [compost metagenome]